jgi:hypothetical protein
VSLRAALLAARAAAEDRLREDRARLAAIEARLAGLEPRGPSAGHHVFLSSQPAQLVGAVRDQLVSFAEADGLLAEAAGAIASPVLGVIWHDCGRATGRIDCEGLVALPEGAGPAARSGSRRVRVRRLPRVTTACVVHCGSDAGIGAAYAAARRWIDRRGYGLAGPVREWYLQGAADGPDAVTEIHVPVTPRRPPT